MLDKLHIKNFLTFDELLVKDLRRVNLIAGQNNSGKTALLEAIRILQSFGDDTVINNVLDGRGLYIPGRIDMYKNLFHKNSSEESRLKISINNFEIDGIKDLNLERMDFFVSSSTSKPNKNDLNSIFGKRLNSSASPNYPNDRVIYVSYRQNNEKLEELWSNIVLTSKEEDVLNILRKSINLDIERIDISGGVTRVKIKNAKSPIPMSTMGDGINRILLIALSLANAENSILLIDEIEIGLHHTVLEKLWKLIFKYAQLWDIQVFVTTHSQDAIRTFYYVASEEENKDVGKYFRLQKSRKGKMEAIPFDLERLESSISMDLEIR